MKSFVYTLLAFGSFSALGQDVTFKCSPKYYDCAPYGECRWRQAFEGEYRTIGLDSSRRDPDIHRARYQTMFEGHQLTLDFRYDEAAQDDALTVKAYLGAANVLAESSGTDRIEIALRNEVKGAGFVCTGIRLAQ